MTGLVRTLVADLIGPFGGPRDALGFAIVADSDRVKAMKGLLGLPLSQDRLDQLLKRLDAGDIAACRSCGELGHRGGRARGADTATRAQLVWQVKVLKGTAAMSCSNFSTLERGRTAIAAGPRHAV